MKAVSFVNLRKCFPTLTEPTVMILSVGVLLEGIGFLTPIEKIETVLCFHADLHQEPVAVCI